MESSPKRRGRLILQENDQRGSEPWAGDHYHLTKFFTSWRARPVRFQIRCLIERLVKGKKSSWTWARCPPSAFLANCCPELSLRVYGISGAINIDNNESNADATKVRYKFAQEKIQISMYISSKHLPVNASVWGYFPSNLRQTFSAASHYHLLGHEWV